MKFWKQPGGGALTYFVVNKAKGQISKWVFQENKASPNFPKNLACFVYLKYPFLDSPFSLITDDLWEIFIVGNFWHILYKMCRVCKVLCNIAFCCIFFSFFWVFLFALYLKFLHYLNWWKTYFLQNDISANLWNLVNCCTFFYGAI